MIARLGLVLAALALSGCAGIEAGDQSDWNAQASHPPLRSFRVEIEATKLSAACNETRALLGCAVRLTSDRVCIIYTAPKAAAWVLAHEQRHCEGWDHA